MQVFLISLLASTCFALHTRDPALLITRQNNNSLEQIFVETYLPFMIEMFGRQISVFPAGTTITVTSNGTNWKG
jgi:hypothetical protein